MTLMFFPLEGSQSDDLSISTSVCAGCHNVREDILQNDYKKWGKQAIAVLPLILSLHALYPSLPHLQINAFAPLNESKPGNIALTRSYKHSIIVR